MLSSRVFVLLVLLSSVFSLNAASPTIFSTPVHRHAAPSIPTSSFVFSSKIAPPPGVSDIPLRNVPGLFSINITVGTPPQPFSVQLDTGSSTLAIPATSCNGINGCSPLNQFYSAVASSTSVPSACNSNCQQCTADGLSCFFAVTYGDGSGVNGSMVTDVVRLGPFATTATFGQFTKSSTGFENPPVSGIMGIAYAALNCNPTCAAPVFDSAVASYPSQLPNIFSLCLTPTAGIFTMGGYDSQYIVQGAAIQYTPIITQQYYAIYMSDVKVGGVSIGLAASYYQSSSGTIVDSGTTLLALGLTAYNNVFNAIMNACNNNLYPNLCSGIQNGVYFQTTQQAINSLPSLTFVLGQTNPITITIPPSSYIRSDVGNVPGYPYSFAISSLPDDASGNILGDTFMLNQYIVFDRVNARLGFAPGTNCGSMLPQVYSVTPSSFLGQVPSVVSLQGSGFLAANGGSVTPAPTIYFNSTQFCSSATIVSDSLITCTYTPGSFENHGGFFSLYAVFNSDSVYSAASPVSISSTPYFQVDSLFPSVGSNVNALTVTLRGSGFMNAASFNVTFRTVSPSGVPAAGWSSCSPLSIRSDSILTCTIPANTLTATGSTLQFKAGYTPASGPSYFFTPSTAFIVSPPPAITSVSPTTLTITSQPFTLDMTTVTVTGSSFGNAAIDMNGIYFNVNGGSTNQQCAFSAWLSSTSVLCSIYTTPYYSSSSSFTTRFNFMVSVGNQNSTAVTATSQTFAITSAPKAKVNPVNVAAIVGSVVAFLFLAAICFARRNRLRAMLRKSRSDDTYIAMQDNFPTYPSNNSYPAQQQQQQQYVMPTPAPSQYVVAQQPAPQQYVVAQQPQYVAPQQYAPIVAQPQYDSQAQPQYAAQQPQYAPGVQPVHPQSQAPVYASSQPVQQVQQQAGYSAAQDSFNSMFAGPAPSSANVQYAASAQNQQPPISFAQQNAMYAPTIYQPVRPAGTFESQQASFNNML